MTARGTVLIIDDDPGVRFVVRNGAPPSFVVKEAGSGDEGLRRLFELKPVMVVLDLDLPGLNGREVLHRVRAFSNTPIIMLTASDREQEIVNMLNLGADEYVTKPFSPTALWARIEAVLRRASLMPDSVGAQVQLDGGQLVIDSSSSRVWVRGQEVPLTATEFRLLRLLASHADQLVSQEQILVQIWGEEYVQEDGYVPTYIRRLRTKIERDPSNPAYLVARRGLGYMLVSQPGTGAPSE